MSGISPPFLKVGIVSGILHPRYGGPAAVVDALYRHLSSRAEVTIWGRMGPGEEEIRLRYPGGFLFPERPPHRWFRCGGMYRSLLDNAKNIDVLHAHMLWDYPTFAAWRIAKKRRTPFVVTPHGTINESWRRRGIHKRCYRDLVLRRMYGDIACMQALNDRERIALEEFGVDCPIEVIPNGVDPSLLLFPRNPQLAEREFPALKGKRRLIFLGRLWKDKGLDILLPAWEKIQEFHRDWILVLAGPDYRGYAAELERLGNGSGTVLKVGMVTGFRKEALLAGADVFTLPSRSEGFSIALLEALAMGLPVVYSNGCNFPDAAHAGAGIETDGSINAVAEGLTRVLSMSDSERDAMGRSGRKLVAGGYTWDLVADALLNLYRRVSGVN